MFNIFKLQDIHIEDVALRQSYYNDIFNGRVEIARRTYDNHPQLWGKALTADMFNQLLNSIYILEDHYRSEVTEYWNGIGAEVQILIDELIYMNNFNPTIQYSQNNFVSYNEEIYYCKAEPPIGTLPTDSTYWLYLGLQGDDGAPDLKINYQGIWSDVDNYSTYDAVIYQNEMYIAKRDNIGVIPSTSDDDWLFALHVLPQTIFVSKTEPVGLVSGNLWIEILE